MDDAAFNTEINGDNIENMDMNRLIRLMRNSPVVGDYESDQDMWKITELIAKNEKLEMKYRLEAFAKMNELTGEDDPVNELELRQWMADLQ
jgi:hypothetical protein